jgi:hypothetical protein
MSSAIALHFMYFFRHAGDPNLSFRPLRPLLFVRLERRVFVFVLFFVRLERRTLIPGDSAR